MISIITCTHKAPPSIGELFRSLGQQTSPPDYEMILVNNGFSVARAGEVTDLAKKNGLGKKLRIVDEPIPGLSHARKKGFLEAKGDWFLLLDDDNSLSPGFLGSMDKIVRSDDSLGGITPLITPVWEQEPPQWLQMIGLLCLSYNQLPSYQPIDEAKRYVPEEFVRTPGAPGGGMMVHRDCVMHYLTVIRGSARLALGRKGKSLMSGEDFDLWSQIPAIKRNILVTDTLQVYHHIPSSRLDRRYLLKLNFALTQSRQMFHRMTGWQPHPFFSEYTLEDFKYILRCLVKEPKQYPQSPFFLRLLLAARKAGEITGNYCSLPK
jgi:glycosyltransferase involved in cell wall biosynthesis